MAIREEELRSLLTKAFPDSQIEIKDLVGDGDHYAVEITSAAFSGKSRVAQHQLVYAALKGRMDAALHALSIKTSSMIS